MSETARSLIDWRRTWRVSFHNRKWVLMSIADASRSCSSFVWMPSDDSSFDDIIIILWKSKRTKQAMVSCTCLCRSRGVVSPSFRFTGRPDPGLENFSWWSRTTSLSRCSNRFRFNFVCNTSFHMVYLKEMECPRSHSNELTIVCLVKGNFKYLTMAAPIWSNWSCVG